MSLAINVQDGTSAGKRRLLEPVQWAHLCGKAPGLVVGAGGCVLLRSYSCPDCGARRP